MNQNPHIHHLQRFLDSQGADYRRALADVQLKRVSAGQAVSAGTALAESVVQKLKSHLAKGSQPVVDAPADEGWQVWCDAPVVLQHGIHSLFGVVLWHHGAVRFAAALDFENEALCWAGPGEGAHVGRKARVADRAELDNAFISVPVVPFPAVLAEAGAQGVISRQPLADVLAVASGAHDACVQTDMPYEHNMAALMFVQEAGGMLTDAKSQPVSPATQTIVAANSKLQGRLLKALRG